MDGSELRRLYEAEKQRLESENRKLHALILKRVCVISFISTILYFTMIIQSSATEAGIPPMIQVALAAFAIGLILGKMF